jgi:hypothetical protein
MFSFHYPSVILGRDEDLKTGRWFLTLKLIADWVNQISVWSSRQDQSLPLEKIQSHFFTTCYHHIDLTIELRDTFHSSSISTNNNSLTVSLSNWNLTQIKIRQFKWSLISSIMRRPNELMENVGRYRHIFHMNFIWRNALNGGIIVDLPLSSSCFHTLRFNYCHFITRA